MNPMLLVIQTRLGYLVDLFQPLCVRVLCRPVFRCAFCLFHHLGNFATRNLFALSSVCRSLRDSALIVQHRQGLNDFGQVKCRPGAHQLQVVDRTLLPVFRCRDCIFKWFSSFGISDLPIKCRIRSALSLSTGTNPSRRCRPTTSNGKSASLDQQQFCFPLHRSGRGPETDKRPYSRC